MKIYKVKLKPTERKLEIVKAKELTMNPSDRLEEIKQRLEGTWDCSVPNHEVEWLLAKIVEQDREIEQLRRMTPIANVQLSGDAEYWKRKADYQRRHRKWALGEARRQSLNVKLTDLVAKSTHEDLHDLALDYNNLLARAEKAEAELSACKERVRELEEGLREIRALKDNGDVVIMPVAVLSVVDCLLAEKVCICVNEATSKHCPIHGDGAEKEKV